MFCNYISLPFAKEGYAVLVLRLSKFGLDMHLKRDIDLLEKDLRTILHFQHIFIPTTLDLDWETVKYIT